MNEPLIGKRCPWLGSCTMDCELYLEEPKDCALTVLAILMLDFKSVIERSEKKGDKK